MSGPFVVVSRSRIRAGRAAAHALWYEALCRSVEENEPRMLAFNAYESEDRQVCVVVQIHPDAESMEYHLSLYADKVLGTPEYDQVESIEICGAPSEALERRLQADFPNLPVTVVRVHRAGFTRLREVSDVVAG
ncbi:hypothetical protein [Kribbella deserti]|uniref:Uncharacterized protein n=1 Tax=Kribbella deserti TaxID=1926257 RepID=A0ABV6QMX9_9ACTN